MKGDALPSNSVSPEIIKSKGDLHTALEPATGNGELNVNSIVNVYTTANLDGYKKDAGS